MEELYKIITWPESQDLMELPGFEENCCLINDDCFIDLYGSGSYFVNVNWLKDV